MGFKAVGAKAPETNTSAQSPSPTTRTRAATPAEQEAAPEASEEKTTPTKAPAGGGIVRSTDRPAPTPAAAPEEESGDPLAWTRQGGDAEAKAAAEAERREQAREERRARGYWPRRFQLIPPGTPGRNGPINDRYQADIVLLDDKPGPSYYEHLMRNPRTGRLDVYEPCPKEYDSCILCPPSGEYDSQYVMLLTVMNLRGFTYQKGPRMGQHVPITHELLAPLASDQAFFYDLYKEHGTLRGIQLTMTCSSRSDPRIGKPSFVGKFSDEEIEKFVRDNGMWQDKMTQEGEKIADAGWIVQPFTYSEFLHKPTGADLRQRYTAQQGGSGTPVGAVNGNDPQWGSSRYQPGTAQPPQNYDELEDDVPF